MSEQAIVKAEPKADITLRDGKPIIGTLGQAARMAKGLVAAGWTKLNETQATMAVMHGATLGLTPFQAVQGIAVINGRPTLWGDSLVMRDGYVLPPQAPGLGVRLTDEIKQRYPFVPGSGEFNTVPGKILED